MIWKNGLSFLRLSLSVSWVRTPDLKSLQKIPTHRLAVLMVFSSTDSSLWRRSHILTVELGRVRGCPFRKVERSASWSYHLFLQGISLTDPSSHPVQTSSKRRASVHFRKRRQILLENFYAFFLPMVLLFFALVALCYFSGTSTIQPSGASMSPYWIPTNSS